MNQLTTFQNFLTTHSGEISLAALAVNLTITALLCAILGWVYTSYGATLSNRSSLARNFVLIGVTTTLIITVVKASLALSLGLVGALSIVRFRAAIKEPEELAFLFLTIAIGLGLGANQRAVTLVAFVLVVAFFIANRHYTDRKHSRENFFLTLASDDQTSLADLRTLLEERCSFAVLKRYEKNDGEGEVVFLVEIPDIDSFEKLSRELSELPGTPRFTFVEDMRIV